MMKTTLMLAAVLCVGMVTSSPSGAPDIACETMTPQHGFDPQTSLSPYTVSLSSKKVQPRASVAVTITAATGDAFRGFFVQARDANNAAVGTFDVDIADTEVQAIACAGGTMNAATHKNNNDKASVMIGWTAPSTPVNVTFTVTIVRQVDIFWVGMKIPLTVAA